MVKRSWIALAALTVFACRTTPTSPDALSELPKARTPEAAKTRALVESDPGEAAVIAWIEGNDRALARKRLDDGIEKDPTRHDLFLIRAAISIAELDDAKARDDLLHVIDAAPDSAEAETALVMLFDRLDADRDTEKVSSVLTKVIDTARAERVRLATAMAARLARASNDDDRARELLKRGGFLHAMRGIGPIGPLDTRLMDEPTRYETSADWSKPELFRGTAPAIRSYGSAKRGRFNVREGAGLYVLETYVELDGGVNGQALLLEAHLPTSTRIRIGGEVVVDYDLTLRRRPALVRVPVRAAAGWHRVTITLLATSGTRPSVALLRADGKPVVARQASQLPDGAQLALFPPAVGDASTSADATATATGLVERWIADETWSWFGRTMASVVHLSGWYVDVEGARQHLFGVEDAAPASAALHMARARLMQWSQLPAGLIQAAVSEALEHDPDYAAALVSLGVAVRSDDPDRALELAERAAAAAPQSVRPDELRFRILRQRGWNAEAVQMLRSVVKRGASRGVLLEGAQFLRHLERVEEANDLHAKVLARGGDREETAKDKLKRGDLEGALSLLRERGSANTLAQAAALSLARGDVAAASKDVAAALEKDPLHVPSLEVRLRIGLLGSDATLVEAAVAALRKRGSASIQHEALGAIAAKRPLARPPASSWLGETLAVDLWPSIRYLPGTTVPKGLDPADPRSRYKSVKLLDRVVDFVRPTGQALSWRHEVTRLQTKEATDKAGEFQVPGDALPLTLRTLKPDGKVVDVDRHSGKDDLSFSALAPGDAVELEWVDVLGSANAWGGYLRRFYFKATTPLMRSDYVVVVPKGAKVWTHSYNGAPQPTIHEEADRTIYVFSATDVAAFEPEPHAAPPEEYLPFVVVAVGTDTDRTLAANTLGLEARARSSFGVERKARELTNGIDSGVAKTTILFDWVTKNIGDGRSRDPAKTLATKRGNRSGLFTAMLRAVGIEAELVLAEPGVTARPSPRVPSAARFETRLVRVRPDEKTTTWALVDGRRPWLGKLPPVMRGGAYVTASQPSRVEPLRDREIDHWVLGSDTSLEVDEAGNAAGTVLITLPGTYGAQLREFLAGARKEAASRQLQGWLSALIPGARLVDFSTIGIDAPREPFGLKVRVAIDHFMVPDGGHLVNERFFDEPLALRSIGLPTLGSYLRTPVRKTPMMMSEAEEQMTVSVRFPKGTRAPVETPKSFTQILDFGQFTQAFEWDEAKREARLVRVYRTPQRRLPPSAFPAFRESAQEILQSSRNRLIVPAGRVETAALSDH